MMSCGKHRCMTVCCNAQEHVCTRTCNGLLNCRIHRCDRVCHTGSCTMCYEASRCKYSNLLMCLWKYKTINSAKGL